MINDHHQFIRMEEVNETDIIAIDESENNDNVQEKRTDEEVSLGSSEKKSTNLPPIRAASTVWQYYERIFNDEGVHVHSKCKYCDQKYSAKCSTTTLNDHWKKRHLKIRPGEIGSIEAAFKNAASNSKSQAKLQVDDYLSILDKLVDLVIVECLLFRIVDSSKF